MVTNKRISFFWELKSIFMYILRKKKSVVLTPNMAALSHGCKPRIALLVVLRTSRCHTHEMGKFHGVADRVQSPNQVMQLVEKT